jgi:protein-S-isoprenylcysteine O-methyltransferase Ste14
VSPIYAYRIRAEETMLQTRLGEQYKAYMARSWRLIPRLY